MNDVKKYSIAQRLILQNRRSLNALFCKKLDIKLFLWHHSFRFLACAEMMAISE